MALSSLKVTNYQSLESAEIEFGALTVLVGPSNSGKSAVLRAIKTLVRNAASPAFVTTGAKQSVIRLDVDGVEVVLERGKGLSKYRMLHDDEDISYPRSGTQVPDDVQGVLQMPRIEDQDLNFAFQFDRPFLLDESSTQVAKVLGDLSNINILYAAVREANRRRLDVVGRLKVRREDEVGLTEELKAYTDLPQRRKMLEDARAEHGRLVNLQSDFDRLTDLIEQVEMAASAVAASQQELDAWPDVSEDLASLEVSIREHSELGGLIGRMEDDASRYQDALAEGTRLSGEIVAADEEYHAALVAAGTCPLCGQAIEGGEVGA